MTTLHEKVAAQGVRLTQQRELVLAALAGRRGHVTADRLLADVQEHDPSVNKTTIYRTLDLLVELGMVCATDMGGNQTEYELLEQPHHHLICKGCDKKTELPDDTLNPLRQVIEQEYGFRPSLEHFALFGLCAQCRSLGDV